jgi:hypothetical protein
MYIKYSILYLYLQSYSKEFVTIMEIERTRIINELVSLQDEFYASSSKNIFFKKKQKMECAQSITNTYDIDILVDNTCYIIPGSDDKIFFDYRIFKIYAFTSNYSIIIARVVLMLNTAIAKTGKYEFHMNLSMFSASAAERYKGIIEIFCKNCLDSDTLYSEVLTNFYLYNTPSMIDLVISIIKRWTPSIIQSKVVFFRKNESDEKLLKLLHQPCVSRS